MLIMTWSGEAKRRRANGSKTDHPRETPRHTDPDRSLQPRDRGATMTYGRCVGRNDREVRGGKQAANFRLELGSTSSPDASPPFAPR